MSKDDETYRRLLELGVPWPIAREAVPSTALDRDQTHSVEERKRVPSWLVDREEEDGVEGLTMLGHGLDDEP